MPRWIRILTPICGDRGAWAYEAGQVVRLGSRFGPHEIPSAIGLALCDGVRAAPLDEGLESGAAEPSEVAALRTRRLEGRPGR
jgi:hypothetical protein